MSSTLNILHHDRHLAAVYKPAGIGIGTDDSGDVTYVIDPKTCTECADEGGPQCKEECPVPECIEQA